MDEVETRNVLSNIPNLRVQGTPDQKKWAMNHLLLFMTSPHASCRRQATSHMGPFFQHMPEMQEQATDVVYDLCEDLDQEVRLLGYDTLPQLVKRSPVWTARNTDVLVQLLQSEDDVELVAIRRAIGACITADPSGALPVICDYAIAMPEGSESQNPELTNLVLSYLTTYAHEDILHALVQKPDAISAFASAILKALDSTNLAGSIDIINKIIYPLIERCPTEDLATGTVHIAVNKASAALAHHIQMRSSARNHLTIPDALVYFEEAATVSALACGRIPVVAAVTACTVLDFANEMLLDSTTFDALGEDERLLVSRITLEFFAQYAVQGDLSDSRIVACRNDLAGQFDKLCNVLLKSCNDDPIVIWRLIRELVLTVAVPSWEAVKSTPRFSAEFKAIRQSASNHQPNPDTLLVLEAIKRYDPIPVAIRRRAQPLLSRPTPSPFQTTIPSPTPSSSSLNKRKADSFRPDSVPASLLSRLTPDVSDERSQKRPKVTSSPLNRMGVSFPPNDDSAENTTGAYGLPPKPLFTTAQETLNSRGPPTTLTRSSGDLRPSETSNGHVTPTPTPAASVAKSLSIRGSASAATPSASASSSFSIRGAADKAKSAVNTPPPLILTVVSTSPPPLHSKSLLERAGLAPTVATANNGGKPKQEQKQAISIQDRLSAPSLSQRLSASLDGDDDDSAKPHRRARGRRVTGK